MCYRLDAEKISSLANHEQENAVLIKPNSESSSFFLPTARDDPKEIVMRTRCFLARLPYSLI